MLKRHVISKQEDTSCEVGVAASYYILQNMQCPEISLNKNAFQ